MLKILLLFIFIITLQTNAGTLIYKNSRGEKKIISEVTIQSMDNKRIILKINKGTEILSRNQFIKYYDSDVNLNLAFEDNTADYGIFIQEIDVPTKGVSLNKKRKITNDIKIKYSIAYKKQAGQVNNIKMPYFYIFVLTRNHDGVPGNNVYTFSYPNQARVRMKGFDEAKMLEQVIAANRPRFDPYNIYANKGITGTREIKIPLKSIGNREIVSCFVVVWGKDDIVATREERLDHQYHTSKNWYLQSR